jgi:hypothetical protein
MQSNTQKLRVLRARTDHDLLIVVQQELDRAFALADVAASRNSPLFAQAEKALSSAASFFSKVARVDQDARLLIETRLKQLRSRLEQVPAYANARPYKVSAAC